MWRNLPRLISTSAKPGPRKELRPTLPSHPAEGQLSKSGGFGFAAVGGTEAYVQEAGSEKLLVLRQPLSQPDFPQLLPLADAVTFGRRHGPLLAGPVGLSLQSVTV